MPIVPIRTVNTTLLHARIYLDDLFEIEAYITRANLKLSPDRPITFEYRVNHLTITTREELLAYCGASSNFALRYTYSVGADTGLLTALEFRGSERRDYTCRLR